VSERGNQRSFRRRRLVRAARNLLPSWGSRFTEPEICQRNGRFMDTLTCSAMLHACPSFAVARVATLRRVIEVGEFLARIGTAPARSIARQLPSDGDAPCAPRRPREGGQLADLALRRPGVGPAARLNRRTLCIQSRAMKAVVHAGAHRVEVRDVAEPRLEAATDVVVKVTTSGICGSDLHMYKGRTVTKEQEIVLDPQQLS
jgi:hypothetical protein